MEVPDDEGLPDAALVMLRTRQLNQWAHTRYTFDEVAEMDWLTFAVLGATAQGMNPTPVEDEK